MFQVYPGDVLIQTTDKAMVIKLEVFNLKNICKTHLVLLFGFNIDQYSKCIVTFVSSKGFANGIDIISELQQPDLSKMKSTIAP